MRWRGLFDRTIVALSRAEAQATRLAALVVDGLSRSALRRKFALILRAVRLESRPSAAEWLASALLGLLALATPLAAWLVFDRIVLLDDDGPLTLAILMIGAAAFVALEAGVRYGRLRLADRARVHRDAMHSARALSRWASAPLGGDDGAPARVARLEAVAGYLDLQSGGLRRAVLDMPYAAVALAAMAWLGGWLVLAPLALIAAVFVLFAASTEASTGAAHARDAHDARSDDFIAECAANLAALRAGAMEPFMLRRMEQLLASGRDLEWRRIRAADRAEDLTSLLEAVTVVAVVGIGGVIAVAGELGLGALAGSALLAVAVVRPVVRIATAAQRAAALAPRGEALEEDGETPALRTVGQPATLDVDALLEPGARRICFQAPPGASIAFTAHDGATLSRLLRVLGGLEAPLEGHAAISGIDAVAYRTASPGAVALVPSRPSLFAGTIIENLTLFGQGATTQAALAACDMLGLRPEIDRLPRRLETRVGEGMTDGLSASLAHRLCLARAIALGPRILLLEEPQARLDPAAERALLAGIGALHGRTTVVLCTSRPSWMAMADRAFTIDCGRFEPVAAPRAGAA